MNLRDLDTQGDRTLLDRSRRAILISRTPRRPAPATPWVRASVEAAQRVAADGEALVAGIGREPFHLVLSACKKAGGAAVVVLNAKPSEDFADVYRELLPEWHLLVWPRDAREKTSNSTPSRDRLIGELSDRAYAIQIRKGGNMAAVADMIRSRGGEVDERFAVASKREKAIKEAPLDLTRLKSKPSNGDWPFLTHYTREPDGAWPGESLAEYANWLAFGPREARRDAIDALRRILSMRVITASGRLMPASTPMVSFTARPPWELGDLIRWRRGLRRWTVRPYGLALRRDALERLDARQVAYQSKQELAKLAPADRVFAQSEEWSREAEWRVPGDCLFSDLPPGALRIVVPEAGEARALEGEFGVEAHTLLE